MRKKVKKKENINSKIRSALRRVWLYSNARRDALTQAKMKGISFYICQICGEGFVKSLVQVDHVVACGVVAGNDWGPWIERLFYGELQVLCKPCHLEKTKRKS